MIYVKKILPFALAASSALTMILIVFGSVTAQPMTGIVVTTLDDGWSEDGYCSLREAIEAANQDTAVDACAQGSSGSPDDIYLAAGTYILSEKGADGIVQNENQNKEGDLDISGSVHIHGLGVDSTILDGASIERVFDLSNSAVISLTDISIQNGRTITGTAGGGGILVRSGVSLFLNNCKITGNRSDSLGGGLDNWSGSVVISNCTVQNNMAGEGGGIYSDGALEIYTSLIFSNTAVTQGGGLNNALPGGDAYLENVTLSHNHSVSTDAGSGIFSNGTLTLVNSTLVHNIGFGAGFASLGTGYLKNSIIALQGASHNCTGGSEDIISWGHNLEDGDTCHLDTLLGDLKNTDPFLVGDAPHNNGGMTLTYALESNSPAIDAGTNTGCPSIDQRGFARPKDGDGDGVLVCDIGAFEYNPFLYFPLIFK